MKFLIVDDDKLCRVLLQKILSPYAECDLALDGAEAAEAVRLALEDGSPYDLVCLDIMMPGTDGHQALDLIRRLECDHGVYGSDGTKIIMTTALNDSKHCIRAFREGCESFVAKPIDRRKLLDEVEALLGPISRGDAVPQDRPDTSAAPPEAEAGQNAYCRRSRFLIVDDDRLCRELLRDILSRFGQCDVAYDGQEAIEAVRLAMEDQHPYDLVCLDIMMPGADGHDALKGIRMVEYEYGRRGSDGAKVIMTTALHDSKHCVRAFTEGCESYVTKPVDEDKLLGAMRGLGLLVESSA